MVRVSAMLPTVALVLILGSLVPAHLSRTAGFFRFGTVGGKQDLVYVSLQRKENPFLQSEYPIEMGDLP
jgi:hypothetical protein